MAWIVEGLARAGAIADAIAKMVQLIGMFAGVQRSVVIVVANYTESELEIDWHRHYNGGWLVNPTFIIPPDAASIYSSRDTGVMTGTKGVVTYKIVGTDAYVQIDWDRPYYGDVSCTIKPVRYLNVEEIPEHLRAHLPEKIPYEIADAPVRVWSVCGAGYNPAELRYEFHPRR